MAKVPDPVDSLDPQARALYDHLVAERARVDGMYRSLLNHPELAQHIGELGSYLRFGDSILADEVRELAILRTARRLGAAYEWVKHMPPARGRHLRGRDRAAPARAEAGRADKGAGGGALRGRMCARTAIYSSRYTRCSGQRGGVEGGYRAGCALWLLPDDSGRHIRVRRTPSRRVSCPLWFLATSKQQSTFRER
jgi:hypothetical protein